MQSKTLKSFIQYTAENHFPIQNIPFGVFYPKLDHNKRARCGTRIGDFAVDLAYFEQKGFFDGPLFKKLQEQGTKVFDQPHLNAFMRLNRDHWVEARNTIQNLLSEESPIKSDMFTRNNAFFLLSDIVMCNPAQIGDYTDFYSSRNHAYNVGCIIRGPDNAIQPNWTYLPVGYHGRSSSIVVSGHNVPRPRGQIKPPNSDAPVFSTSERMDYELEMGAFLGGELNQMGRPIKCAKAEENIFGFVILNDWSARDVQTWEYVPLGPFDAKNFCSVISPWVVTVEALNEFRVELPKQDPAPLSYLVDPNFSSFDIKLDVSVKTEKAEKPEILTKSNFKYLYWSVAQQLTHHAVTGCNMRAGDLLGSGTISGPEKHERGCLLEITWGGKEPITLASGETRTFLKDGDEVLMTGYCESKNGYVIGFGDCNSKILPALPTEEYI
jgi:fumarylacetoacetase